ncbi:hypothetical protein TomMM35A_18420 [Sphingobium sp. TomMM35A]
MPSKPPSLKPATKRKAWATTRKSKQARGYGREHERMRSIVLNEEPLCRPCQEAGRVTAATILDHITPLAEGGSKERENMQPICRDCHAAKTAKEAQRARRRNSGRI